MPSESEQRSFKIGEVCRLADLQPYVLRYWETEFPPLAPTKSGGGQRVYSQHEVDIVLRIKQLLYSDGFTIAGAKKKLDAEQKTGTAAATKAPSAPSTSSTSRSSEARLRQTVARTKKELRELLALLGK